MKIIPFATLHEALHGSNVITGSLKVAGFIVNSANDEDKKKFKELVLKHYRSWP